MEHLDINPNMSKLDIYLNLFKIYKKVYGHIYVLSYDPCHKHDPLAPCSLAATMTSAEGSKMFHYNIPAPLHSTC